MGNIKIAAILTVHNRREKSVTCLKHLFAAIDTFNQKEKKIEVSVFLTDDGCTDGTADAIRDALPNKDIHILKGNGNLFWAGGMRLAWQTAIDSGTAWNYFLLLNDDTNVRGNLFTELLGADDYGLSVKGKRGISTGITCQPGNEERITYGGFNFANWTKGRKVTVKPTGKPQPVDLVSGNILFVHKGVVDSIGILYKGFRHDLADHDYNMTAARHNFPVMATSHICGECADDHDSNKDEILRLKDMTLKKRKQYLSLVTHSDHDYLLLIRRNLPLRYPMTLVVRAIRLYCPSFYYYINKFRGIFKED